MCVEESVHIIFDETNFMTSEHDINNFKIGLTNLEDDEDVTKEQDQRAIGELLTQEQTEAPNLVEQPVNGDQHGVPNPIVPRNKQEDQDKAEQNNNQVTNPVSTTVRTREFVPKPMEISKVSST